MQAATIKIFLVHGRPNGLRTAELSNWSGKAIAAPRTEISDLLKREELASSGFYFLTGVGGRKRGVPAKGACKQGFLELSNSVCF